MSIHTDIMKDIEEETGEPSLDDQNIYDILADADVNGLTTQGDSIADRLRDSLSENPLLSLEEQVKQESGVYGWENALHLAAPREVEAVTTGGGSVSHTNRGAEISPGATAGDEARIQGLMFDGQPAPIIKTVVVYKAPDGLPYTDDAEIGWFDGDNINADLGAYMDLTTEEFHAGTSTVSVPGGVPEIDSLVIEMNGNTGETTFKLQSAGVSETINEVNWDLHRGLASMVSNGAGEKVRIFYVRQGLVFK